MNLIVVKIGGSILRDSEDVNRISSVLENKIREFNGRVIVVVSAFKGVTNKLIEGLYQREKIVDIASEVADTYIRVLSKISSRTNFEEAFRNISRLSDELFRISWSLRVIDEVTPRLYDYVLSFGERMSAQIIAAALRERNINAKAFTSGEMGLITNDNFMEAEVIEDLSSKMVRSRISEVIDNKLIPVITGFIAQTRDGRITTLGRGGSDYTATIFGKFLEAENVYLYTDVDGIKSGDPKIIRDTSTISRLSIDEAIELAQVGGKRFHPRTFEPLYGCKTKVVVTDINETSKTEVYGTCEGEEKVKAVAVISPLSLISIQGTKMVGRVGTAAEVMRSAQLANVNILAISQPISETSIYLVVRSEDKEKLKRSIEDNVIGKGIARDVEFNEAGAVNLIGCGLRNPIKMGEIISLIKNREIFMVSKGLKGVSITLITSLGEEVSLAQELHDKVIKNGQN